MTDREIISLHRAWWRGGLVYGDYLDRLGGVDPDRHGRLLWRETARELAPGVLMTVAMIGLGAAKIVGDTPRDAIYARAMIPLAGLASLWCVLMLSRYRRMMGQFRAHHRRHMEANGR